MTAESPQLFSETASPYGEQFAADFLWGSYVLFRKYDERKVFNSKIRPRDIEKLCSDNRSQGGLPKFRGNIPSEALYLLNIMNIVMYNEKISIRDGRNTVRTKKLSLLSKQMI